MNIALIKNGKVENIIVADLEFAMFLGYDQAIDVTDQRANIGDSFDGQNFTAPQTEPASDAQKANLSKLEFINRFTDTELVGIYQAAEVSIPVRIWLDKFKLAEFIDASDPQTVRGVNNLELAGMIAEGRAAKILHS